MLDIKSQFVAQAFSLCFTELDKNCNVSINKMIPAKELLVPLTPFTTAVAITSLSLCLGHKNSLVAESVTHKNSITRRLSVMSSEAATGTGKAELRRDVGIWGSFMWGYADVGANIYVALGLVVVASMGASPLVFALAGMVYIMIGLAYTELASSYPVAGGGQYFALRGLGDFAGFLSGAALLLDYTINITLFSVAAMGYANFFIPQFAAYAVDIGPFKQVNLIWAIQSLGLTAFLAWLNARGIRKSSLFNEVLGAIGIATQALLVVLGLILAWDPKLVISQWNNYFPGAREFMYGSSLAIISFIGLESISQAAQETRRPATIVPRTSIALIFTVFLFATGFSWMAMGVVGWESFIGNEEKSVAILSSRIPVIGPIAGPLTAILGAIILAISANSGVMSVSRLAYSMSRFNVISNWFDAVHPKYRTPVRTIVVFTLIGMLQILLAFLSGKDVQTNTFRAMDVLANMYAFGATLGYFIVFISAVRLRFKDPYTPRPYKIPFNIKWNRNGKTIDVPILGFIGAASVLFVFIEVVLTHEIGRIAGPSWILLCFIYYAWYRRKNNLPIFGSLRRDWEKEQIAVLESAEEHDLLEQYKIALAERDRSGHAAKRGREQ